MFIKFVISVVLLLRCQVFGNNASITKNPCNYTFEQVENNIDEILTNSQKEVDETNRITYLYSNLVDLGQDVINGNCSRQLINEIEASPRVLQRVINLVIKLLEAVQDLLLELLGVLGGILVSIREYIYGRIRAVLDGILEFKYKWFFKFWDAISERIISFIANLLPRITVGMLDALFPDWKTISSALSGVIVGFIKGISSLIDLISNPLGALPGGNLIGGLLGGGNGNGILGGLFGSSNATQKPSIGGIIGGLFGGDSNATNKPGGIFGGGLNGSGILGGLFGDGSSNTTAKPLIGPGSGILGGLFGGETSNTTSKPGGIFGGGSSNGNGFLGGLFGDGSSNTTTKPLIGPGGGILGGLFGTSNAPTNNSMSTAVTTSKPGGLLGGMFG